MSSHDQSLDEDDSSYSGYSAASATTSTADRAGKAPYLPPCRICSSPASGFHYGVNSCEACKGFFRRSLARKNPYPDCASGDCNLTHEERNACRSCRYKRCMELGMSKDAIKTGRYTHEKRTKDTIEVKSAASGDETLTDDEEDLADQVYQNYENSFGGLLYLSQHQHAIRQLIESQPDFGSVLMIFRNLERIKSPEIDRLNEALPNMSPANTDDPVFRAKTLPFTNFLCRTFESTCKSYVNFMKNLPVFKTLDIMDQVRIVKESILYNNSVLAMRKFMTVENYYVHYEQEEGTLWAVPQNKMHNLFSPEVEGAAEMDRVFNLLVSKLRRLNMPTTILSLVSAIATFSDDHENLSQPARVILARQQYILMKVLKFRLRRDMPQHKNALTHIVDLLIFIRESAAVNMTTRLMFIEKLKPVLPPLLQEIWSTPESPSDASQSLGDHSRTPSSSINVDN